MGVGTEAITTAAAEGTDIHRTTGSAPGFQQSQDRTGGPAISPVLFGSCTVLKLRQAHLSAIPLPFVPRKSKSRVAKTVFASVLLGL